MVKSILKYVKRTRDMFLIYGGDKELVVSGYVDASSNSEPDDSKSQFGYIFLMNGGAISWCIPSRASWRDLRVKRSI